MLLTLPRLALVPVSLATLAFGSDIAAAAGPKLPVTHRAIVPVLAQLSSESAAGSLASARVRIYDLAGGRLVGRGMTGSRGVTVVRLRQNHAPRRMRVVVAGGHAGRRAFRGRLISESAYRRPHAVAVNPVTTLVAAYRRAHPRRSAAVARARVLRSLELPAFYDPGVDFGGGLFDGQRFARQAARHGGFDRYVARLASRVDRRRARAAAVASAACWKTAAQSTAGFAAFLGFRNVPGSPTPACTASASGAQRARTAQFGEVVGVLGDVIGVADGGYSIFAGQSTAATLDAMQQQLDEMQTQLTAIQTGLSELQLEVAAVNQNVTNGNLSSAVDAAEPIVTNIRKDGQDVDVLLRDSYQVICDPTTNCQSTKQYDNFGDAISDICYPNDQSDVNPAEATQCNSYYQQLYDTNHAIAKDQYEPAAAISDLAGYSLGSAGTTEAPTAGIVQYALQSGGSGAYFQSANAANARLEWGYYTLSAIWAQTTEGLALSMGIGQPEPGSESKHPPTLTASDVQRAVAAMNPTIDVFMGAFPNMPDTAVFVTNGSGGANDDGDPPYMWPQQVGGIASWAAYQGGSSQSWNLNNGGAITGSSGGGLAANAPNGVSAAPIVMTPAAANGETWQLLGAGGTSGTTPAMSSAMFGDWRLASASVQAGNANAQQANGPLGDLYGAASTGSATLASAVAAGSGIDADLFTPNATGLQTNTGTSAGVYFWPSKTQTTDNNEILLGSACPPSGNTSCLLTTWLNPNVNPYSSNSSSSGYATGLFDLNNGAIVTTQTGNPATTTSTWDNQWPNWQGQSCPKSNECQPGIIPALDANSTSDAIGSSQSATNSNGRPVLFERTQAANDCFFWNGNTGVADGSGCLTKRTASGQILP